jgi:hypothetical protein
MEIQIGTHSMKLLVLLLKILCPLAELHKLLNEESFILLYAYNADENGLYWHPLPQNIQAFKHGKST